VPWQKPWRSSKPACNFVSKHEYRGVNRLLTNSLGYESPYFVTFNQVKKLKGLIKKGEGSIPIIYFDVLEREVGGKSERNLIVKYSRVWNIEQTTLEVPVMEAITEQIAPFSPIAKAEDIINGYLNRPQIIYGGSIACYIPQQDVVKVPLKSSFKSEAYFYNTIFHELAHSSGSHNRLNREGVVNLSINSQHEYGYEELIAELSSSFLMNTAGLDLQSFNAAYCQDWLKEIKADPKLIIKAASEAEKAANYILGSKAPDEFAPKPVEQVGCLFDSSDI